MTDASPQLPDREERLDEAVAEYLEAVESGQRPERGEWLARYPDLADELAQCIDDQEEVQRRFRPLRDSSGAVIDRAAGGVDPLATLHVPGGSFVEGRLRFPNYQLLGEIARGGMGIVYRARQLNPNRIVALKMILAGPHASAAELYRFRMETEAAASLDHPHIMPIYEVSDQDGRPFFSMKLMEGGTLAEHLPRFAGDGRAAAALLIKIARAVHHAHQRGILHRDLKPANILLDTLGEPYVTDFGLCRRVEVDSGMTQSGVIVGTPSYMSPEQAAGRKALTTATDVYSLGAILYTLLTDRPPFRGNTPLETVRGVLEDEPSRPRLLRPQVDRDLETICLKCLDKQPERRYGSAEALADDLARWLAGEPIVARRSALGERTWKRIRRNPAAAALVGVSSLALVLLIAAGLIYQNHRITLAETALAKVNRVAKGRNEATGHIRESEARLHNGDAQGALLHANVAIQQTENEPELRELAIQAVQLRTAAENQLERERRQADATASLQRFAAHRDNVLIYGSQLARELPANLQSAQAAGAAALKEIGLTPDGDGLLNPDLTESQRRTLGQSSYELLLVLSDIAARQVPPDLARAARLTKRAAELRPSLPTTTASDYFLQGDKAWRQGDLSSAIDAFRKAIWLEPGHVWARYDLASCLLPTEPRESEVHLTAALHFQPDMAVAYLLRGEAHTILGESAEAEKDFEQALGQPQLRYFALVSRSELWTKLGEFRKAEADLLQAIGLRPDEYPAPLMLARIYERQPAKSGKAAELLDRALAAKDLPPQIEAGILHYRATRITHDEAAARADIERSIRLHAYAEAWLEKAGWPLRHDPPTKDDLLEVVRCCDNALESPAYSPETYVVGQTYYLRAHALVDLGRYDDAATSLDRFLAAGGKPTAEIQRLRGLIQSEHGDFPSAIHLYGDSLALDPRNPDTLAERGSVYLAIGALDLALDDFQAALGREKDNANALAGRGMIRAMRGDDDRAEADAQRAWASGPRTQRLAWLAARTLALVYGRLQSRGVFVSVQEGEDKVRYRQQAIEFLEQALLHTLPDQQLTFWQDAVEKDVWLSLLRGHPKFDELKKKYAPAAPEPIQEL